MTVDIGMHAHGPAAPRRGVHIELRALYALAFALALLAAGLARLLPGRRPAAAGSLRAQARAAAAGSLPVSFMGW